MKINICTSFLKHTQIVFLNIACNRPNGIRLLSTTSREFKKTSISELLSNEFLEETIQNQDDVDLEYVDMKKRIEKFFKIEGVGSKLGIITLTSLENSLPAAAGRGKVEIQFHIQHSREEEVSKKDGLSSAEEDKKSKADTSFNIFSDNKLEMEPDMFGMDTRVGINFVARIFQPRSQQVIKLDCFASENMFIKKLKITTDCSLSSSSTNNHGTMNDISSDRSISIRNNNSISEAQKKTVDHLYSTEFRLLNKNLQRSLYRYLSSTWRIGDDVNFFVLACSRQKEQQLYTEWLDKLSLFTACARDMGGSPSIGGRIGKASASKKRRSSIRKNDSLFSSLD